MIHVTFPDGASRAFPPGVSGFEIAKAISPSLAKRTVAMALDGVIADLADTIDRDAKVEFLSRENPRALELIRHDAAHVLAEAVQSLWPGTQVTIGPVIENGFYYDFFRNAPFTPEDFAAIEKRMREIIARDKPFTKQVWSRDEAKSFFEKKGEAFKIELIDAIPADQSLKIYAQGDWLDRRRLQADEDGGRLLARRFDQADAVAHLCHRLRQQAGARGVPQADRGSREARPSQARARDGPVPFPGG